jgi:hypothetical protein
MSLELARKSLAIAEDDFEMSFIAIVGFRWFGKFPSHCSV